MAEVEEIVDPIGVDTDRAIGNGIIAVVVVVSGRGGVVHGGDFGI